MPVEIEALISITPGMFNDLFVNDVVFVAFEENALEQPIVIGKLFVNTAAENRTPGGAGIISSLTVRNNAITPADTTKFVYKYDKSTPPAPIDQAATDTYYHLQTPKNIADYILWLEKYFKELIHKLDQHFRCFKNWVQWQFKPENIEVDDGDLDNTKEYPIVDSFMWQTENAECKVCSKADCTACSKFIDNKQKRVYSKVDTTVKYKGN
jgi:hypothetical protein